MVVARRTIAVMRTSRIVFPDMDRELAALVTQIPPGRTATCGELAAALGDPIAARWVGQSLLAHPHHAACGCHRIVRAGGVVGKFASGEIDNLAKIRRLEEEGVAVVDGKVDLDRHALKFRRHAASAPLAVLRATQAAWAERFSFAGSPRDVELVAGLDVSYLDARRAVGAYALVDAVSLELQWSVTLERAVQFPYISTYLAFRELPILWDLVDAARAASRLADVFLVDGSGILHPRRAGVATCFGVSTGLPTVGVTKKPLYGRPDRTGLSTGEWTYVRGDDGSPLGAAMKTTPRGKKPIYLSPGDRIDVDAAVDVVVRMIAGHKLPEPIYWADRLSRQQAQRRKRSEASRR